MASGKLEAMIIVSASTLLYIAINLGKLALLSIAMAQPMIMAGGTWIALRKLRSIQATLASSTFPIDANVGLNLTLSCFELQVL